MITLLSNHANPDNPSPNTQAMSPARQLLTKPTNSNYPVKETFTIFTTQSSKRAQNLITQFVCKRFFHTRIVLLQARNYSQFNLVNNYTVHNWSIYCRHPVVNFTISVTVVSSCERTVSISALKKYFLSLCYKRQNHSFHPTSCKRFSRSSKL